MNSGVNITKSEEHLRIRSYLIYKIQEGKNEHISVY
jgi:hypothetical protein